MTSHEERRECGRAGTSGGMGSSKQWTIPSVSVWGEGEGKPSWASVCAAGWSGNV
jgi:hypothetical protein